MTGRSARFEWIDWRTVLDTATPAKADRVLRRIGDALGCELGVVKVRPYWKIDGTTEASFATSLDTEDPAGAVYGALRLAARLAGGWFVTAPYDPGGECVRFSAVADRSFALPGIRWIALGLSDAYACGR